MSNRKPKHVQLQHTDANDRSDQFFLQVPSIGKWSNMTVVFSPTGFANFSGIPLTYYVRIYTTLYGIGRIQLDNVNISALVYRRIAQTDFYYYETTISNDTHRISTFDRDVIYAVSLFIK